MKIEKQRKIKPSLAYPELLPLLSQVSKLAYELFEVTRPEIIGKTLGVKKQAVQKHIDKLKKVKK